MDLQIDRLNVFYGESQALFNVSFHMSESTQVLIILGRNGAGKSTTLNTLMGLHTPGSGTIKLNGEIISGYSATAVARKGLTLVPEDRQIFGYLTVKENILFASKQRAASTLQSVYQLFPELVAIEKRRGKDLSGGQRQMVVISRALMTEPNLIMLDEPSQGLAPIIVSRLTQALLTLKAKGLRMIIVEQDVKMCLSLADEFIILEDGQVADIMTGMEGQNDRNRLMAHITIQGETGKEERSSGG